jgi:hypothetical protein
MPVLDMRTRILCNATGRMRSFPLIISTFIHLTIRPPLSSALILSRKALFGGHRRIPFLNRNRGLGGIDIRQLDRATGPLSKVTQF